MFSPVGCVGVGLLCVRNDNTEARFQRQRHELLGVQNSQGQGRVNVDVVVFSLCVLLLSERFMRTCFSNRHWPGLVIVCLLSTRVCGQSVFFSVDEAVSIAFPQ